MQQAILNYLIRLGDATSQWVNVVFLFSENPNESISGRSWRLRHKSKAWGIARKAIDFLLSPFEKHHCELSYYADVRRAKSLLDLEQKYE